MLREYEIKHLRRIEDVFAKNIGSFHVITGQYSALLLHMLYLIEDAFSIQARTGMEARSIIYDTFITMDYDTLFTEETKFHVMSTHGAVQIKKRKNTLNVLVSTEQVIEGKKVVYLPSNALSLAIPDIQALYYKRTGFLHTVVKTNFYLTTGPEHALPEKAKNIVEKIEAYLGGTVEHPPSSKTVYLRSGGQEYAAYICSERERKLMEYISFVKKDPHTFVSFWENPFDTTLISDEEKEVLCEILSFSAESGGQVIVSSLSQLPCSHKKGRQ